MLVTVVGDRLCWWLFTWTDFYKKSSQSNDSDTNIFKLPPLSSQKLNFVTNITVQIWFKVILNNQKSWHHATTPLLLIKKAKMSPKKAFCWMLAKLHVLISTQLKNFTVRKIVPIQSHFRFSKNIIHGLLHWNGGFMMWIKMAILVILFHLDHQEH